MSLLSRTLLVCAAAALSFSTAHAKPKKLGKDYAAMSSALSLTAAQDECVSMVLGEIKKKHRKRLIYPMAAVNSPAPSDLEKAQALDKMFSGSLGLQVITIGATNIDKWKPMADSFKAAKIDIADKCQPVFDADLSTVFELKETA